MGKDKRVDNQKGKSTKGNGLMIELWPLGAEKRNRTARDQGKQLLRTEDPEKYIFMEVKGRDNSKESMAEGVTNTKSTVENYT